MISRCAEESSIFLVWVFQPIEGFGVTHIYDCDGLGLHCTVFHRASQIIWFGRHIISGSRAFFPWLITPSSWAELCGLSRDCHRDHSLTGTPHPFPLDSPLDTESLTFEESSKGAVIGWRVKGFVGINPRLPLLAGQTYRLKVSQCLVTWYQYIRFFFGFVAHDALLIILSIVC